MKNNISPYSASFTGGGFLIEETKLLLPLLLNDNSEEELKNEAVNNNVLMLNAESSRKRIIAEVKKRFECLPKSFWQNFVLKDEEAQKISNFYAVLKTYKLIFDFQVKIIMKKWSSINRTVDLEDVLMEIEEIGANDDFVNEWSEATKKKVGSAYLTILKRVGMLDDNNNIHSISASDETMKEYIKMGEQWFLEFCLIPQYEIERIKSALL